MTLGIISRQETTFRLNMSPNKTIYRRKEYTAAALGPILQNFINWSAVQRYRQPFVIGI